MPSPESLPEEIRELAFRNAMRIDSGVDFHPHMDRLIQAIQLKLERHRYTESARQTSKLLPDVTSSLLGGFSPYLRGINFDFSNSSIEFHLFDSVEQPTSIRVLRFDHLRSLQIIRHFPDDPDDGDPDMLDSIIGAHCEANEYYFHTERFGISFSCGGFSKQTLKA